MIRVNGVVLADLTHLYLPLLRLSALDPEFTPGAAQTQKILMCALGAFTLVNKSGRDGQGTADGPNPFSALNGVSDVRVKNNLAALNFHQPAPYFSLPLPHSGLRRLFCYKNAGVTAVFYPNALLSCHNRLLRGDKH